jgi:3-isopropylmalate dehydrogenase
VPKLLKIAVLGGDGIGPEVTEEAVKVLAAAADCYGFSLEYERAIVGAAAVSAGKHCLPDETLKLCKDSDAILFGAVGDPRYGDLPPDQLPERALLYLRKGLDLYANLRPVKPFPALSHASSLKAEVLAGVDILIVRELVSGIYFGQPRGYGKDDKGRFGFNTMWYHETEVRRIGKVAFDSAKRRKGRVLSCDKANALEVMQLWRETMTALGKEYPGVELKHQYVDNCAMQLVQNPGQFDVIVAGNLFGDIISDIGAQVTGSLGMLPSASIGDRWGLYEPVHGSAPDIAGKGIANPLAAILTAAMLLEHAKGWTDAARAIDAAVGAVLDKGLRTPDIARGTPNAVVRSTQQMGDAVVADLRAAAKG